MNNQRTARAASFTLLEVVIAVAVFFTAVFAILELVSLNIATANWLQHKRPDLGVLAGQTMRSTNITEDMREQPEDETFEYNGGPGRSSLFARSGWERQVSLVATNLSGTNGLYRADFWLTEELARREIKSTMSILMYRPDGLQGPP